MGVVEGFGWLAERERRGGRARGVDGESGSDIVDLLPGWLSCLWLPIKREGSNYLWSGRVSLDVHGWKEAGNGILITGRRDSTIKCRV